MRVFSKGTLRDFWRRHPDAEAVLDGWYREARRAQWNTPADVVSRYPDASVVGNDRIVFRFRGNAYRLVVYINYRSGRAYIRFVGTHAQYDRINVAEV